LRDATSGADATSGTAAAWRILFLAQLREQPGRLLITLIAIALGVALGCAVFLVNAAALNEFGLATKRLVGEADVIVRGPRDGFSEQIFADLARNPAVSAASPVLELEAAVSGHADTLKVLGLDPFRAAALQPALMADIGADLFELFHPDAIYLSSSAASAIEVPRGGRFEVTVGSRGKSLRVVGILSQATYGQALGSSGFVPSLPGRCLPACWPSRHGSSATAPYPPRAPTAST
jgi:putative ABC transport system permease protein